MQAIKSVLQECYGNKEAVTDELVDCILKPGLTVRLVFSPCIPWTLTAILLSSSAKCLTCFPALLMQR